VLLIFPKQGSIVLCLLLVHIDVPSYQHWLDDDAFDRIDYIVYDIFLMSSLRGTLRPPEDGEFQVCEDSTLEEIRHQPGIPVGFHPFWQEGEDVEDECGILHTV
jgi:hypothetical protein